ncbi:MAG: hypothetical protein LH617_01315 [Ramlibacter sp.]|nr:hypothetical protein [Ramlibacter sp.]
MTGQAKATDIRGRRCALEGTQVPSSQCGFAGALLSVALALLLVSPATATVNGSVVGAPVINEAFQTQPPPAGTHPPKRANFLHEVASPESQEVAHWIVHSADNRNLPFVIIDKVQAKVFVFDAQGLLRGASSALLGLAVGDESVPGIGERPLSTIRPTERTTPAGRFVASLDRDLKGEEVLWVDYDTSVSLHRVVTGQPKERRAQRLASPSPVDKRITYGCINVPVRFYEDVVSPAFKNTEGIVYVLPETRSARQVFGSYPIQEHADRQTATPLPGAETASR